MSEAYLKFLYSPTGQDLAGKHYFRPRTPAAIAKYAPQFPVVKLLTIQANFGGWATAQKTHFADGGVFDRIYSGAKR